MSDPHDITRRPLAIRIAQSFVRWCFRMSSLPFRIRVDGMNRYPRTGPIMICSNHVSNLDPMLLGCACPRPVNYLAKKQLFSFKPLGWFLRWNDTIELDREASSMAGIKETLRRLKKKESVILFPEGTRSKDGKLQPFKRGFVALVKKTKVAIMPVAIDGAQDAMPRNSLLPNFKATIQIAFGEAIYPEQYMELTDEELMGLLDTKIRECMEKARAMKEHCRMIKR